MNVRKKGGQEGENVIRDGREGRWMEEGRKKWVAEREAEREERSRGGGRK